jgi:glycosyltransferase involved in cell wall biosynthesis
VSSFARDVREAVAALGAVEREDRLIVFVGKLIASKGVELLLAAWPLVLAREPRARLIVVGFGAFRAGLERLAEQLAAGDVEAAAATRGEDGRELPQLAAFLQGDPYGGARLDRVAFAGRLDHDELADLLPAAEAMAVTSTFPEAFGMVAAEAAAAGTPPLVANHSGLAEVAAGIAEEYPAERRDLVAFARGDAADLRAKLAALLALPAAERDALGAAARRAVVARWSWSTVAADLLRLSLPT